MAIPVFDKGAVLLKEVTFKKFTPHVTTPTFFDPTSATITITSPVSAMVTDAVLSKSNASSTGLFHYILQTSNNWATGDYETKVRAYDGTYTDIIIEQRDFTLE